MKPISGKWLDKGRRFDDHLLLMYLFLCRWLLSTWGLNMHYPSAQREIKEIGICPCEAHWVGRGRGSLPPLGKAGYPAPAWKRGNIGELSTNAPTPQCGWSRVIWLTFPTVSWPLVTIGEQWSMCENPKQTWNLSKNLQDRIFGWKNFTHWKRVNRDYFRQH